LKRVLIVSPHFPPNNMADVHRVRQSLPYFREMGWDPVVLAVDPDGVEAERDELLLHTVPADVEVHRTPALDYHWTRKMGLGSLALRALPYLRAKGDRLLRQRPFDLVYFSTTQFPVLVLGPYWKRRHGTPYVIDMQDPWYSDYYLTRPKHERPPKFWFSHRLDRALEPVAMRGVGGLVAVTWPSMENLKTRYPKSIDLDRAREIPFGVSERDFETAAASEIPLPFLPVRAPGELLGVYTGVCNSAMEPVLRLLFRVFRRGLDMRPDLFGPVRLAFVGTNYAPEGRARAVVMPLAEAAGVAEYVSEQVTRVPYLAALRAQLESDFLLLTGTRDPQYTASKLYPYVFTRRPILAIFHERSTVVTRLRETGAGNPVAFRDLDAPALPGEALEAWIALLEQIPFEPETDWSAFEAYTARAMTARQVELFEQVTAATDEGARRHAPVAATPSGD
jgi:hypothetical protein